MTRFILLAACLVAATTASAQPGRDAASATVTVIRTPGDAAARGGRGYPIGLGGTGLERVLAVASDAAGNSYVTGDFAGTIDFDPGPGQAVATSTGETDFFGAPYGPAGGLRWAFRYGSAAGELGSGVAWPSSMTARWQPGATRCASTRRACRRASLSSALRAATLSQRAG